MSNQPNSPNDYLSDVLARFDQARDAREFGEALVWANTGAVLDSASDRIDPTATVNTALFQLVFDTALASESLVLKCGNVTTTHGDLLAYGQEANDLLVARLNEQSPEQFRSLVLLVEGHFNNLFEHLDRHFDRDAYYTISTGEEAKLLRDTTATIRQLLAAQSSLKIKKDIDLVERATLLQICLESPDFLVVGFPLRFFTVWDKAVFFIESAQSVLTEIKSHPGFSAKLAGSNGEAVITALEAALATSLALTSQESKKAKASYPQMIKLGSSLTQVLIR